jgi:integrase
VPVKVRAYRGQAGVWEVDITVPYPHNPIPYRERKRSPKPTEKASLRWGEGIEARLWKEGDPRLRKVAPAAPTLDAFFADWLAGTAIADRRKASTAESYRRVYRVHIAPHFGARTLDSVTLEDVQAFKAKLSTPGYTPTTKRKTQPATVRGYEPATINQILTVLGSILRTAEKWERIAKAPPVELLPVPTGDPKFYDFDDYEQVVEAARVVGPAALVLVLLGGEAGLRRGEIAALEWADVNLKREALTVSRQQWDGPEGAVVDLPKGGKARSVPLTGRLLAALRAHQHLVGPRVLYDRDAHPVTGPTLKSWLCTVQRRAGFRAGGDVHILRHTFGSHLAMRGAPVRAIQELMGHAHLEETMRYMHLSPSAKEGAIRLLEKRQPLGEILEKDRDGK